MIWYNILSYIILWKVKDKALYVALIRNSIYFLYILCNWPLGTTQGFHLTIYSFILFLCVLFENTDTDYVKW